MIVEDVAARVRDLGQRAPQGLRALGRRARRPAYQPGLVIAAGLAVVVVLVVVAALTGTLGQPGGSRPAGPAKPPTGSATGGPLIAVQEYRDSRGIVVNVPEGWTRSAVNSYVDFTDPTAASLRKVRINIESTSGTAQRFLQGAENGLKNPARCPSPYRRVGLHDAELDGRPAAELEYTCGSGTQMRHGIWRAVVVGGKVYHFYLTVPDPQFAQSKVIFDEMVRSFRLID